MSTEPEAPQAKNIEFATDWLRELRGRIHVVGDKEHCSTAFAVTQFGNACAMKAALPKRIISIGDLDPAHPERMDRIVQDIVNRCQDDPSGEKNETTPEAVRAELMALGKKLIEARPKGFEYKPTPEEALLIDKALLGLARNYETAYYFTKRKSVPVLISHPQIDKSVLGLEEQTLGHYSPLGNHIALDGSYADDTADWMDTVSEELIHAVDDISVGRVSRFSPRISNVLARADNESLSERFPNLIKAGRTADDMGLIKEAMKEIESVPPVFFDMAKRPISLVGGDFMQDIAGDIFKGVFIDRLLLAHDGFLQEENYMRNAKALEQGDSAAANKERLAKYGALYRQLVHFDGTGEPDADAAMDKFVRPRKEKGKDGEPMFNARGAYEEMIFELRRAYDYEQHPALIKDLQALEKHIGFIDRGHEMLGAIDSFLKMAEGELKGPNANQQPDALVALCESLRQIQKIEEKIGRGKS